MPTPVPVSLASAIPLTAADISGAISNFFAIGAVLSLMLLVVSIRFGPKVWRSFTSLMGRR